jgi:hypothetical protein
MYRNSKRGVGSMNRFHVVMVDELGDEFSVTVEIPDLVDNVTEWLREEYPDCSIVLIRLTF